MINMGKTLILVPIPKPRGEGPKYPSKTTRGYVPLGPSVGKPTLTPEMQQREEEAQKAIRAKQKRIAPVANKMGYQYIHNNDDLKTMGRKT